MKHRKLVLVPVGGLANRMRTISSATELCKRHNLTLEIIWFKDPALNTSYKSLFEPITLENVTIREATFIDYFLYDRPRLHNFFIPRLYQMFAFTKCIYEQESLKRFYQNDHYLDIATDGRFYLATYVKLIPSDINCANLKPVTEIQSRIESLRNKLGKECIGVHIRRGDNLVSISESPLYSFTSRMDMEIDSNPEVSFYLATDSDEVKAELIERYGNRITTMNHSADRLSESGMRDAVIELYLLTSTKKILGSYHSTYSQIAAELGGIDFEEIRKSADK